MIKCVKSPIGTNKLLVILYFFSPTKAVDLYINAISSLVRETGLNMIYEDPTIPSYESLFEPWEGGVIDLFFEDQSSEIFPHCVCSRLDNGNINEVFRIFSVTEALCIYSPNKKRIMELIDLRKHKLPAEIFNGNITLSFSNSLKKKETKNYSTEEDPLYKFLNDFSNSLKKKETTKNYSTEEDPLYKFLNDFSKSLMK